MECLHAKLAWRIINQSSPWAIFMVEKYRSESKSTRSCLWNSITPLISKLKEDSIIEVDDPAEGDYTFKLDITGIPQYFYWNATRETIRTGPWNGETFSGTPNLRPDSSNRFSYTSDDEWIYFLHEPINTSVLTRTVVTVNGTWQRFVWNERNGAWSLLFAFLNDACDIYNTCGPYASCDITSKSAVMCKCLEGYVPKSQRDWDAGKWTEGCVTVRRIAENCSRGDAFTKHSNVKVPDTRNAYGDLSMSLDQCRMACLGNCSCTAYGNWYVTYKGTGCVMWLGELNDIRVYADEGQEIYVRGDSSARTESIGGSNAKGLKVIIASSALSALVLVVTILLIIHVRKLRKTNLQLHRHSQPHTGIRDDKSQRGKSTEINNGDLDLPIFDIKTISRATDNFSADNKLGQGGFGPVYKGLLQGGQGIAVKKLSQDSKQGSDEFKNEVMCIAKLQHRNLVKLLGCCIQEEYMLIYEFLPNKSLDLFIFGMYDNESSNFLFNHFLQLSSMLLLTQMTKEVCFWTGLSA
uniref:non-specific serine/threonine protein kinase n=1 Tax=Kalanchoe fedtschenkoi TaxID=63787 RepID=A0A7N0VEL8_KALFE